MCAGTLIFASLAKKRDASLITQGPADIPPLEVVEESKDMERHASGSHFVHWKILQPLLLRVEMVNFLLFITAPATFILEQIQESVHKMKLLDQSALRNAQEMPKANHSCGFQMACSV